MVALSVLDLSPIRAGETAGDALRRTRELAQACERFGYKRFWVAEHHNMASIASAATSVVIGYVAAATSTIRVGAGGVMLPNHAPLIIAEHYGTLDALYPGRIDLGLGRAPGTDPVTAHALRRTLAGDADRFPEDVEELMAYFAPAQPGQRVRAVPGAGQEVPIWILGSSLYGAQFAAYYGLPFAFASHFAPEMLMEAIRLYRTGFRPSARLERSYLMAGFNVLAAETDEEANFLASSGLRAYLNRALGLRTQLEPPAADFEAGLSERERAILAGRTWAGVIGSRETVRAGAANFVEQTGADELIIATSVYDHAKRVKSYEILAEAAGLP
jgi:luciferase family oxidoreductase group 1